MTTRMPIRAERAVTGRVILAATTVALLSACATPESTAYVGATLWRGDGTPPITNGTIVVRNGHILSIGAADDIVLPRGATEVRLDGRWVIPGLVDAHTHVERWTLTRFLAHGITSVRDVGGDLDSAMAIRDDVELGSVLGPRMYASGAMLDGPPAVWPAALEVATPEAARQAVDRLMLLGATQVKLYTKIDVGLLEAILDEATSLDLPVTGHLGKVDALTAAELGISAIEHLTGIVEATVENPGRYFRAHDDFFAGWNLTERSWPSLDSAALERTAASLIEHDVTIVPTLTLHEAYSHLTDQAYVSRLDLSGVPEAVRAAWDIPDLVRRARLTSTEFRALRQARPYQDRFVRMYHRTGGKIATGTDTPNQLLAPGISLHDELVLLVRAGLAPGDALLSATRGGAQLVRADSIGVLKAGAVADFVVLNGNPLEDISRTRDIQWIVFRGVLHSPTVLMEQD